MNLRDLLLSHFKLSRDQSVVPVMFSEAEFIRSSSCCCFFLPASRP
jgi:hypothetical protein